MCSGRASLRGKRGGGQWGGNRRRRKFYQMVLRFDFLFTFSLSKWVLRKLLKRAKNFCLKKVMLLVAASKQVVETGSSLLLLPNLLFSFPLYLQCLSRRFHTKRAETRTFTFLLLSQLLLPIFRLSVFHFFGSSWSSCQCTAALRLLC